MPHLTSLAVRPDGGTAAPAPATASAASPWGRYLHVIVVSVIGGFGVLLWFVLYEWLNKLIWDAGFVTDSAWISRSSACRARCSSDCW